MLKMTVRPLAIKNSSMPNRTPLRVDMTISSSTTHRLGIRATSAPKVVRGGRLTRANGQFGLDLGRHLPAPAGLLLVERLLLGAFAERGDIHRLEKLVVVLAHGAFA